MESIVTVILQIVESSSSDDEGNKDIEEIQNFISRKRRRLNENRRIIVKNENYIETIMQYAPDTFKSHFRLSREAVENLEQELLPAFLDKKKNELGGRDNIPLQNRILLALWKMANGESFRGVADRFGVGISTAHNIFIEICVMVAALERKFITWPLNYEATAQDFNHLREVSFPGIIGAVDGMDIQIIAPVKDKDSYYNRKGTFSIKMQGICDSKCRFTDIFIGCPGGCHDAFMWKSSPVYSKLKNENITEYHLIGDSAYPLDVFLMKPFKDNGRLSQEQKRFNRVLSSHRVVIENAFGLLKGKFRILKYLHMFLLEKIPTVVMACCILHNIALKEVDASTEIENSDEEYIEFTASADDDIENEENRNDVANRKRHYLCAYFNN